MNSVSIAKRLAGFSEPTVWTVMTPLAIQTKSINLGQGFPSWQPPQFYLANLTVALQESNHQYVRAFGSLTYTKAIAQFHSKTFGNLDPETEIVTCAGGVEGLYCCFMGLINEGDEVILFDPSYDCYRPQVQMAGGKCIGVPLKPKYQQNQAEMKDRENNGVYVSGEKDEWEIDFKAFESAITAKTKIVLINSPHNPVGKVFSENELQQLTNILHKHPQIVIVEDNVYEGITFDEMAGKALPKMAFQEGMKDRTLSVYSAGKLFAVTGVRSGWVIGCKELITAVRSVHQYNVFCSYNVLENALTRSLQTISETDNNYLDNYSTKLTKHRNLLLQQLVQCKYDIDLWVPKGGYFILADISRVKVQEKYLLDEHGRTRTKDYAMAVQMAYEDGVVAIPCSPFYGKEDKQLGERYIRFTFCKDEEMILEAGRRIGRKNL